MSTPFAVGRVRTWALVLLFVASLPAVTTRLSASDEIEFFSWLRSWTFDRDVDFQNEYQHFYDAAPARLGGFRATFLELTNEAGRRPNFAPIGSALLWAPFYAAGHVVARLTGAPTDGFSPPYIVAVTWGSAFYGWAALLLTWQIARTITGRGGLATIAVALGTPIVFYMYVAPGFSHACSAFAVALFLWVWLRVREAWTMPGVVALAVAGALLPMVREQDVFFLVGPVIDAARALWRSRQHGGASPRPAAIAAGAVAFVCAYAPQWASYAALNGHPGPTTLVTRKMSWNSPHFFEVLTSSAHGLFVWTPLAAVACAGLVVLMWRRTPTAHRDAAWLAGIALLLVILQAYVSGCVESWTVAGSFGQRRFVAVTPLLGVGLAALVPAWRAWRPATWVLGLVVVLCVWWNVGLMAQFGLHLMDRQRLSPAADARRTFVELPVQVPAIVWRYLTARESFYGLPPQ